MEENDYIRSLGESLSQEVALKLKRQEESAMQQTMGDPAAVEARAQSSEVSHH